MFNRGGYNRLAALIVFVEVAILTAQIRFRMTGDPKYIRRESILLNRKEVFCNELMKRV